MIPSSAASVPRQQTLPRLPELLITAGRFSVIHWDAGYPLLIPAPRSPPLFAATTKGRSSPEQLLPPPYTLLSSPSCRSSRSVVPGRLGHRALHCRLQTHGKLPLLRIPRHDGHRFHLDNGLFLRRSPTLRLVQVGARVLSKHPRDRRCVWGSDLTLGCRSEATGQSEQRRDLSHQSHHGLVSPNPRQPRAQHLPLQRPFVLLLCSAEKGAHGPGSFPRQSYGDLHAAEPTQPGPRGTEGSPKTHPPLPQHPHPPGTRALG